MRERKDSGVQWIGEIPAQWTVASTKFLFTILSGATPESTNSGNWDGEIRWITPADYKTNDVYVECGRRNLSQTGFDSCSTNMIPAGSIIFSKRAPIGSVAINSADLCTNQGCLSCVNKGGSFAKFYYYVMSIATEHYELLGSGTTFKEISAQNFSNFKLPCPDCATQRETSDYLDKKCSQVDTLIANVQAQIEKLKAYKQSVITEVVTKGLAPTVPMKDSGVEWIGEIPGHWSVSKVSMFYDVILGKMLQPEQKSENDTFEDYLCAANVGNNALKLDALKQMWFSEKDRYQYEVQKGDLIVVEGGDVASCDIVKEDVNHLYIQNALHRVRSKKGAMLEYLRYSLMMAKGRGFIALICNKATIAHFTKDKFMSLPLLVMPIHEQEEIVAYLDEKCAQIDHLIALKQSKIEKLEQYKKSLIYEYVTGKKEVQLV